MKVKSELIDAAGHYFWRVFVQKSNATIAILPAGSNDLAHSLCDELNSRDPEYIGALVSFDVVNFATVDFKSERFLV